jgi:hypothetical protein
MKTLRIWLSYFAEPPFRLLNHIIFRLMGYSRLRIGTLTFWGPRDFLESCTASVRRLQELDSELYARLTTQQKLVFCYMPKHLQQAYFAWIFSINDAYTVWQSDGIIARIVYSSQLVAQLPRRTVFTNATSQALHSEVNAKTRLWLEAHSFPEPLVDCFREQAI